MVKLWIEHGVTHGAGRLKVGGTIHLETNMRNFSIYWCQTGQPPDCVPEKGSSSNTVVASGIHIIKLHKFSISVCFNMKHRLVMLQWRCSESWWRREHLRQIRGHRHNWSS
jgi:hypothetical protein